MNEKPGLHPKNKHKSGYDFNELTKCYPSLKSFVAPNKYGNDSIDFSNPLAVKTLNSALLKFFYNISYWDIPAGYLCPPIPGRADYIHHVADLLANQKGEIPSGPTIKILDIGVGANCVYPLIAHALFGWSVVGSEIDEVAAANAQKIVQENSLESSIIIRKQENISKIFESIINPDDHFHLSICNPPFHSSAEEARAGSDKKNRNLGLKKNTSNFGGQNNELWCRGGESLFIKQMIKESLLYKDNCLWFSTLVSKIETVNEIYEVLKKHNIKKIRTLDMAQGQKKSRIIAWSFSA